MSISVTIELTDEQVAMLRPSGWAKGPSRIAGELLELVSAALPPEPVRLTIELPAELANFKLFDHVIYSGATGNSKSLMPAEAEALTAVVKALKAKAFEDAMADGIDQLKAQGVPLT